MLIFPLNLKSLSLKSNWKSVYSNYAAHTLKNYILFGMTYILPLFIILIRRE